MKINIDELREIVTGCEKRSKLTGFMSTELYGKKTLTDCMNPYINLKQRLNSIMDAISAKEFALLLETDFTSTEGDIREFAELLLVLCDEGVFKSESPFAPYPFAFNKESVNKQVPDDNTTCEQSELSEPNNENAGERSEPSGEEIVPAEDNSGKAYDGPVLEINFVSGDKKAVHEMSTMFHEALVGHPDYKNTNVIVSNDPKSTAMTLCLEDLVNPHCVLKAVSDMFDHAITSSPLTKPSKK